MTISRYPEIEALNIADTHAALSLGYTNLDAVMQSGHEGAEQQLRDRIKALEAHRMRLIRANRAKSPRRKR